MHPDSIVAGLQAELATVRPGEEDRRKEIEVELAHAEAQPRPVIEIERPDLVADQDEVYLAGLQAELANTSGERQDEIAAEIVATEERIAAKRSQTTEPEEEESVDPEDVSEEEIAQRKQTRTKKGVQHARNKPVPGDPPPPEEESVDPEEPASDAGEE